MVCVGARAHVITHVWACAVQQFACAPQLGSTFAFARPVRLKWEVHSSCADTKVKFELRAPAAWASNMHVLL